MVENFVGRPKKRNKIQENERNRKRRSFTSEQHTQCRPEPLRSYAHVLLLSSSRAPAPKNCRCASDGSSPRVKRTVASTCGSRRCCVLWVYLNNFAYLNLRRWSCDGFSHLIRRIVVRKWCGTVSHRRSIFVPFVFGSHWSAPSDCPLNYHNLNLCVRVLRLFIIITTIGRITISVLRQTCPTHFGFAAAPVAGLCCARRTWFAVCVWCSCD